MINELWSGERYSTEQLNARLKFFIGIILGLTLFGIVFVVLYSLIFVTQPMNGMTLSGIMLAGDDKDLRGKAIDAANKPYTPPPEPPSVAKASAPVGTGFMTTTAAASTASFDVPSFAPETGFGGKPAPAQPPHPEV